MAQVYSFVDENGVTRLFAEIHPDPAGTPFNGGTITDALGISPATDVSALTITPPFGATANFTDEFVLKNDVGSTLVHFDAAGDAQFTLPAGSGAGFSVTSGVTTFFDVSEFADRVRVGRSTSTLGFYGHTAAVQQTLTSATATPEQIALALQATGLCGGT